MKTSKLLYSTSVAIALLFTPFVNADINTKTNQSTKTSTTSTQMVNILYSRGLDKNAAKKMVDNFLQDDEELLEVLLENLENRCSIVSRDDILEYLSTQALHKNKIDLASYPALINMLHNISGKTPDVETLSELQSIASLNYTYTQLHRSV
jgi:hypothetical protein